MTCREFIDKVEGLTLAELSSVEAELLAQHGGCASCGALLRERHALAGALRVLRSTTNTLEAPAVVEQNVLRAFRQSSAVQPTATRRVPLLRWSDLFGWKVYAAAAAVVAICLGLGLWLAQRSDKTSQQPTAKTEQPSRPSVQQTDSNAQLPVQALASKASKSDSGTSAATSQGASVTTASLTQSEQAQGYTPLMLCDPISCSGDAEVVRMELPATGADGSAASQMADVIVGDDGLVRAIRIVQQQ